MKLFSTRPDTTSGAPLVQTRKFSNTCEVSAMYNWIGSFTPNLEHFILSICGVPVLDPSLPITVADRTLVNMAEYKETPFPGSIMNCPEMSEIQATESTHPEDRAMSNIPLATEIIYYVLYISVHYYLIHCCTRPSWKSA